MSDNKIRINYKENLERVRLDSGQFKLLFNVFKNVLGSNLGGRVYISQIAPSRTEIKVKLVNDSDIAQWDSFKLISDKIGNYVVNFGNNNTILITNWVYDDNDDLIFKLYEPLFDNIEMKSQLWISKIIAESFETEVMLTAPIAEETYNQLASPNFQVKVENVTENSSDYQTWDDVLSSNVDTSNNLIDKYFSQSYFSGAEINIDYSDYANFVHFGSAKEKLDNFQYKLQLLEGYGERVTALNILTSSIAITGEVSNIELTKRKVINGFDGYESYLYNVSSSDYTVDREYNQSSSVEYIYSTSWPKTGPWYSQSVALTTDAEAINWYTSQSEIAEDYDRTNLHGLTNTIPNYLQYDEYNDQYVLFVNMIGHFFDNIWTYTKAYNDLSLRENDINLGISKDLVYDALESFGIKLNNGNNLVDLWTYSFGNDSTGSYLNTSEQVRSIANKDITVEIWNRVLNNLPYLLKTKGTKRGIQALLTCYGIPTSILDIKEYGGPVVSGSDITSDYQTEKFYYALPFSGVEEITGVLDSNTAGVEIRTNFTDDATARADKQIILSLDGTELRIEKVDTLGKIVLEDASANIISSSNLDLFDGDFWNIMIATGSINTGTLYVRKFAEKEMIYSDTKTGTLLNSDFAVGKTFNIGNIDFIGELQEVRFWATSPTEGDFEQHVKYPNSIAITNGTPYDDLSTQYAFANPENLFFSASIWDSKPNQKEANNGVATGFISVTDYPYNYTTSSVLISPMTPSLGYNVSSNKTRIESNTIISGMNLGPDVSAEIRAYDYAPIDSPRVGVFFSLTNLINERIIQVYSNENYDNYIGDPASKFKNYYPELRQANEDFWNNYAPTMSISDYLKYVNIYDSSLFDTIRDSLPARTKKDVGILIEPHILQRSRVPIQSEPTWEDLYHETLISVSDAQSVDSEMLSFDSINDIDINKATIDSEYLTYNDEIGAKASERENGDVYITFNSFDIPTGSDVQMLAPMIYPKCNFMTPSAYLPTSGSGWLEYSDDNYVLNSNRSLGYLTPRYIGCLQTIKTTLDGQNPVIVSITTANTLLANDGGESSLIVR